MIVNIAPDNCRKLKLPIIPLPRDIPSYQVEEERKTFHVIFFQVYPFSGRNEQFHFLCVLSGAFNRRKRNSIYVTVTLLIVSVLILTVGLAATTRTQNVTVGGYYPGVIVSIKGIGRSRQFAGYRHLVLP